MLVSRFHLNSQFENKRMRIAHTLCSGLGLFWENTYCTKNNLKEPLYCLMNNEFTGKAVGLNSQVSKVLVRVEVDTSTDGRKTLNTSLLAVVETHWVSCTFPVNVAGPFLSAYFAQVNTWDQDDPEKCHSSRKLDKNWDAAFPVAIPSTLSTFRTPRITASLCGLWALSAHKRETGRKNPLCLPFTDTHGGLCGSKSFNILEPSRMESSFWTAMLNSHSQSCGSRRVVHGWTHAK